MTKEAYYFSHDCNARNDDKIIAVRMRHKAEGYGVYFMLLERLRESSDYSSVKDYNMLAFDFRVSADLVKSIVEDFGLFSFTDDGKRFYSESFSRRMKQKDDKSEKARQSASKRWDMQTQCKRNANASLSDCEGNALKEKKGKEKKEISPSIPQGGSGGAFLNLSRKEPPLDEAQRNYEALFRNLTELKVSQEEFNEICALSNYGEIGNSVWKAFESIKKSSGKITMPGKYIISIIRKTNETECF